MVILTLEMVLRHIQMLFLNRAAYLCSMATGSKKRTRKKELRTSLSSCASSGSEGHCDGLQYAWTPCTQLPESTTGAH